MFAAARQGCPWKQWIWKGTLLHSMPMRRGKPSDMEDRMEFPTGGRGEKAKGAWNDEN